MSVTSAIVAIQTEVGAETDVFEKLFEIPEVKEAFIVYGTHDIVLKLEAESLDKVREIVSNKIRRLPEVRSVTTMIVVEEKKKL